MTNFEGVEDAYDRWAPVYDAWNAENDYEMWLGEVLLPELERYGVRKGWALDVGCGTGRAFGPLLGRGWQVVGCDVSSQMLAEADRKFGSRVQLLHVDARRLPLISPAPGLPEEAFELILLLNDVVNYLTEEGDLEQLFAGVKRNLSREGLVVFDANTLALFRADYAAGVNEEMGGWRWEGLTEEVRPGAIYEGRFSGGGVEAHIHRQRHWTSEQVLEALEAAHLRCLAALGQREEGGRVLLSEAPDEERDAKVVYVAGPGVRRGSRSAR
jgi:SAM-dependent methyltransferase